MKSASVSDIRKKLAVLDRDALAGICVRLAAFKKENKELLTYLLFEADDETSYVSQVKSEMDELFDNIAVDRNMYFVKKSLRKVQRFVNRQIRYSANVRTELELRLFFCSRMMERRIPVTADTIPGRMFQR